MRLRSTRGGAEVPFLEAVDRGLAPDGGLFLPIDPLRLPPPPDALGPSMRATAGWALRHLLGDEIPTGLIDRVVEAAFDFPIPVEALPILEDSGASHLLDLTRGPTRAFKDVGARFLARFWALHPRDGGRTVLVATSGDTGGAVADACHGVPGLQVIVLFPAGRVSEIQRRQFTTLGGNVHTVAVEGAFDRCQALAKEAFGNEALRERHHLTSANSINIGRLLPQLLPYVHLARHFGWGTLRPEIVVPSGNLGNVWAARAARAAGTPLGPITAATNRNDTFVRWTRDGSTEAQPTRQTPSTAMDVGRPSNLERIARENDAEAPPGPIEAVAVSDEDTLAQMRLWAAAGRTVDPHTAVGLHAAAGMPDRGDAPRVVVETASPAKFPDVLARAGVPEVRDPRLDAALDADELAHPLAEGDELEPLLDRLLGA